MERRLIVIVVLPDCLSLDVVGPGEVFSSANHVFLSGGGHKDHKPYELVFASGTRDVSMATSNGLSLCLSTTIFDINQKIDTLIIGGFSHNHRWKQYPELNRWLMDAAPNIRRICSICVGAFVLAESGLLKGKKATTHWRSCQELGRSYPDITVDSDRIYVRDGNLYTSAGASTGIDLALALVEEDHGRALALAVAQLLVLFLKRPGNQSQYSGLLEQQFCNREPIRQVQEWIMGNIKKNLTVDNLAEHISMSPRNFARVFLSETGLTPAKYVERLRVETSKRLLESTSLSLEKVADECGFGSIDTMRKIYVRTIGSTPSEYRQFFGMPIF